MGLEDLSRRYRLHHYAYKRIPVVRRLPMPDHLLYSRNVPFSHELSPPSVLASRTPEPWIRLENHHTTCHNPQYDILSPPKLGWVVDVCRGVKWAVQ
jgi:hypothetical protein